MMWVLIILIILLIISLFFKYKYTTIRYKSMVRYRNVKTYIKKNDVYIITILNKLNIYINKVCLFFDTNPIIQELIQSNRIPIRVVLVSKNILNLLSKFIVFIISKLK